MIASASRFYSWQRSTRHCPRPRSAPRTASRGRGPAGGDRSQGRGGAGRGDRGSHRAAGTEVADHAGGGEPVLGGQHGVEVRQPAPFRRCGRSEEDGDRLQVGVGKSRQVAHLASAAANANGGTGSRTPGMQSANSPIRCVRPLAPFPRRTVTACGMRGAPRKGGQELGTDPLGG